MVNLDELIDLLKRTRVNLERRQAGGICLAVESVRGSVEVKRYLKRWIYEGLQGMGLYGLWLGRYHPGFRNALYATGEYNLTDGRLQWIDWMIEQCEKEKQHGT